MSNRSDRIDLGHGFALEVADASDRRSVIMSEYMRAVIDENYETWVRDALDVVIYGHAVFHGCMPKGTTP